MSLANDFAMYTDEIDLIRAQNRVECDLYSIIACIIRERKHSKVISLRDVSARRGTEFSNVFKGESGFLDFVIRERVASNKASILGAIEVKYIDENLEKHIDQLKGHLNSYKKVIFTNGINWKYYEYSIELKPIWEVNLGTISNGKITWYKDNNWKTLLKKLDEIEWY